MLNKYLHRESDRENIYRKYTEINGSIKIECCTGDRDFSDLVGREGSRNGAPQPQGIATATVPKWKRGS